MHVYVLIAHASRYTCNDCRVEFQLGHKVGARRPLLRTEQRSSRKQPQGSKDILRQDSA
jgi:hypothetical protein